MVGPIAGSSRAAADDLARCRHCEDVGRSVGIELVNLPIQPNVDGPFQPTSVEPRTQLVHRVDEVGGASYPAVEVAITRIRLAPVWLKLDGRRRDLE
jgi:hypothetical protein